MIEKAYRYKQIKNVLLSTGKGALCLFWIGYGIAQLVMGWGGISEGLGTIWAWVALFGLFVLRFTLPFVVGSFYFAWKVLHWHWALALLFSAPSILLIFPTLFVGAAFDLIDRIHTKQQNVRDEIDNQKIQPHSETDKTIFRLLSKSWSNEISIFAIVASFISGLLSYGSSRYLDDLAILPKNLHNLAFEIGSLIGSISLSWIISLVFVIPLFIYRSLKKKVPFFERSLHRSVFVVSIVLIAFNLFALNTHYEYKELQRDRFQERFDFFYTLKQDKTYQQLKMIAPEQVNDLYKGWFKTYDTQGAFATKKQAAKELETIIGSLFERSIPHTSDKALVGFYKSYSKILTILTDANPELCVQYLAGNTNTPEYIRFAEQNIPSSLRKQAAQSIIDIIVSAKNSPSTFSIPKAELEPELNEIIRFNLDPKQAKNPKDACQAMQKMMLQILKFKSPKKENLIRLMLNQQNNK